MGNGGDGSERTKRAVAGLSLTAIVAVTLVTLGLSLALKQPCAAGDWSDGRQYKRLCYSDIIPLYGTEHLTGSRLPYLNPCPASAGLQCDEYPVLTMYLMRIGAWIGHTYPAFFYANVFLLSVLALITSVALYRVVGERALYFAAAPTLLIYAFVNWDLLAVALATLGTVAYLRNRDGAAGALLGLGAAAKLYPALLVIPFALGRFRHCRKKGAISVAGWAAIAFAAVNLPFALAARSSWLAFFRFNTRRLADWDSMWFVACSRLKHAASCPWSAASLNALSLVLFVVVAVALWSARTWRQPDFPRWTFGFPLLVAFLLTNKVYSPQYGLWLVPWFGLALPNPWLFAAFEVSDAAVFLTRFTWFGRLASDVGDPAFAGFRGVSLGAFQVALAVRAAVLVVCLAAWVTRQERDPLPRLLPSPSAASAA